MPAISARPYDDTGLSSRAFWSTTAEDREKVFATLRRERPVTWHPPVEDALFDDPSDPGYWAIVRHADIVHISRHNDVFVSGQGVLFENIPPEALEASQSFLAMDPPRHTKIRKLVSAAFTRKQVKQIENHIRDNAKQVVQELAAAGSGSDFVSHCAAQLPLRTLSDMMGIPDEDRQQVSATANDLVSWGDAEYWKGRDPLEAMFAGQAYLHQVAFRLAEQRREQPGDDLISSLVTAEIDGERLTDAEVAAFFVLLAVAGNDTTRHTASHALKALTEFPDQHRWLVEDFDARIGMALTEFVRWATPVMTFRRTAVADVTLGDQQIAAGDKVVMFYSSGNRDETVFDRPGELDLSRDPNPHLGFGGGGAHFCLGNQVARVQLRALFDELLHQLPDIAAGEPEYLAGNFVHSVRALPCTFGS